MSASCEHSSVFFSMNIVRDKHDSWEKNRSRHFNRFEWAKQRRGGGEIGNCFEGSSGFRHGYPCTGCQGAHGSTRAAYFAIPWRPFLQRQIVLPQPLLPCFLPSPKARKTGPEEQKDGSEESVGFLIRHDRNERERDWSPFVKGKKKKFYASMWKRKNFC